MTTKQWRRGSMTLALACMLLTACDGATGVAVNQSALTRGESRHEHHNPNPALFAPDARPFGVSMESWSEQWWRWAYSMPAATNPNTVATADCGLGQDGPLFFLPSLFTGGTSAVTRTCKVPAHKPIGLPLVTLLLDYP